MIIKKNVGKFLIYKSSYRKKSAVFGLFTVALVLLFSYLYYNVNYNAFFINGLNSKVRLLSFVYTLIKFGIYALMSLVVIVFVSIIYIWFFTFRNNTIAILSEKGIWLRRYRFILWESIEKILLVQPSHSSIAPTNLALWLKTDSENYKKLSFNSKIGIFLSKKFGSPHITFGSMDRDENFEIFNLVKNYLKK